MAKQLHCSIYITTGYLKYYCVNPRIIYGKTVTKISLYLLFYFVGFLLSTEIPKRAISFSPFSQEFLYLSEEQKKLVRLYFHHGLSS